MTYSNGSENTITAYARPWIYSPNLEPNTTYEFRYRYRNSSSCQTGSPDPWSPIADGTTPAGGQGGGGGGGGGRPDLIVDSASASDTSPGVGTSFTLSATVRNHGNGSSAATTLRYYASSDATISSSDSQVGTDAVGSLNPTGVSSLSIGLTAPSAAGTYYYGACVDAVAGESNIANNCSHAVRITVGSPPPPPPTAASKLYWTDWGTDKIQRGDLDGSNVEDLVASGLNVPYGLALDLTGDKMYWTDRQDGKIRRADLGGSNVEVLLTLPGLAFPGDLVLDVSSGRMYWTNPGADRIQRANLDGSNVEDLLTSAQGLVDPSGLAVGVVSQNTGGDGGGNGDPLVAVTNTRCSGQRQGPNSNSVVVTMQGTVTALKTVISGTITGYANQQLVGAYNLSAMSPGQSVDFTITGTITTSESALRCRTSWEVRGRNIGLQSGFIEQ